MTGRTNAVSSAGGGLDCCVWKSSWRYYENCKSNLF